MIKALSGGSSGGLRSLFSGGMNIEALSAAVQSGRKIKQRSQRKRVIPRKAKKRRR